MLPAIMTTGFTIFLIGAVILLPYLFISTIGDRGHDRDPR
jgi:hypothetical protein